MKTGNTGDRPVPLKVAVTASMEPGHEDREYHSPRAGRLQGRLASMEPGHEDREYVTLRDDGQDIVAPQWSPAMKTGNTKNRCHPSSGQGLPQWSPAMKTGNTTAFPCPSWGSCGLNGARP